MVGRRDFLRKTAAAGAFAIPIIVTVDPADAQTVTSPPPQPPGSSEQPRSPVDLSASPGAGSPRTGDSQTQRGVAGRVDLPRSGADIDRLVAAGLAATAGGAALVLWSAELKSESASTMSPGPEPET
jgi:hypothetical protein